VSAYSIPIIFRSIAGSLVPPAKSSNAFSVTRMMWLSMNGAPFGSPVFRMLEAAFPFEHRPAVEAVLRELGENAGEIDLAVAQRAEAPGAVYPALVAGVDALAAGRVELGVLDVERLDALVVDVDEGEIVQLLQQEVRRVVVDVATRVVADGARGTSRRWRHRRVLAGMQLEADVDAGLVEGVEDRRPALAELVEGLSIEAGRAAAATGRDRARPARRKRSRAP
jgi:hypothetical protein